MNANGQSELNARANLDRFAADLLNSGGGTTTRVRRESDTDTDRHGIRFFGFSMTNRGNEYGLCVQGIVLPAGPSDDHVVILDGEDTLWVQALSRIRSARSELRQALDDNKIR